MSDSLQPDGLQHMRLPCPSVLKVMSIESVMPSKHLTLCCSLVLLPSIFSNIRDFSNVLALQIRWPNYCTFSFSSWTCDWQGWGSVRGSLKEPLSKKIPELTIVGEIKLFGHIGDIPLDPRLPVFLLSDSLCLTESSLYSTGQPSRRKVPISLKHQEMQLHSFAILHPYLKFDFMEPFLSDYHCVGKKMS